MSLTIKICPKCDKSYSGSLLYCPDDGEALSEASAGNEGMGGRTIDGKFVLLEPIGKGGMGSVFKAMQLSMEREVAVKLLHSKFSNDTTLVKRFMQEARGASKLNHPNIISLYDFGESDDGTLYLAMELLEGVTLAELLHQEGPLEPERAVQMVGQICDGLHYAHEMGVVHRDIKPDNIFVMRGAGRVGEFVKVLDFGIAKIKTVEHSQSLTKAGMVCGTPAYVSPEQAMARQLDGRSDIYSLGVVLFQMLSGKLPYTDEAPMELLLAHVNNPLPFLADVSDDSRVPVALEKVMRLMLAKKPQQRPNTSHQVKLAVNDAIKDIHLRTTRRESSSVTERRKPIGVTDNVPISTLDQRRSVQPTHLVSFEEPENITPRETEEAIESLRTPHMGRYVAVLLVAIIAGCIWFFSTSDVQQDRRTAAEPASNAVVQEPVKPPEGRSASVEKPSVQPAAISKSVTANKPSTVAPRNAEKPVSRIERAMESSAVKPTMDSETEKQRALKAKLHIVTIPPGATLWLQGHPLGTSPITIERPEAGSTLKVTRADYKPQSISVDDVAGGTLTLSLSKKTIRRVRRTTVRKVKTPSPVIFE